jgi:hypothetical protein
MLRKVLPQYLTLHLQLRTEALVEVTARVIVVGNDGAHYRSERFRVRGSTEAQERSLGSLISKGLSANKQTKPGTTKTKPNPQSL